MFYNLKSLNWIFLFSLLKFQSFLLYNIIWLRKIFGNWIIFFVFNQYFIEINLKKNKLKNFLFFLKNHTNTQYNVLSDLVCIDYPGKKLRFKLSYILLSYRYSSRIKLTINIKILDSVQSIYDIFKNSNWLEREVWDLFGIFFFQNQDLRRILTDYGFEGHPLRKDFPLTGFLEISYIDKKKKIIYEPVSLAQEFRLYEYKNPWIIAKY